MDTGVRPNAQLMQAVAAAEGHPSLTARTAEQKAFEDKKCRDWWESKQVNVLIPSLLQRKWVKVSRVEVTATSSCNLAILSREVTTQWGVDVM